MANIRVDLNYDIKDGSEIVFRSPVDCSAITGLAVYCTAENGAISAYEFALTDAHGQDVGNIDHLFAEDVIVKVILDVTAGKAYVQNADTNDYIERTFAKVEMVLNALTGHNSSRTAHEDIREEIQKLRDACVQGSGQNLDYSTATNKPSINGVTLEGNKTAEELGITGLTDEQVSNALGKYVAEHPDSLTTGATPEQVAKIEASSRAIGELEKTDTAIFTALSSMALFEADLSGCTFKDTRIPYYYTQWDGGIDTTGADTPGHHQMSSGYIHLHPGDVLLTNADNPEDVKVPLGTCTAILLWELTETVYGWTGTGAPLMFGRGTYDGQYRAYVAERDIHIGVAYKYDVDYDIHFYVARRRTGDGEPVPFRYSSGYIKANSGEVVVGHATEQFLTGYHSNVVSELLTIQAPGKYLLVDNAVYPAGQKSTVMWARYAEDGTLIHHMLVSRWPENRSYYIIPLVNEMEYVRFAFTFAQHPAQYTTASIVDAEYLIHNGYAEHVVGKSMAMFGDSYVAGHNIGNINTWHYMFAEQNQMQHTNLGTNGIGLCKSPNLGNIGLIDKVDTLVDADYIGVIIGRNDYSMQVPIGTNDDMVTDETDFHARTFKGGLNYLCQYLVENYPARKVFFVTPWYFPGSDDKAIKPVEYIDAILEVTGLWGIPCFDAARRSGIHCRSEAFRGQYFLSADDVSHLNAEGAKLMMDNITGWMLAL